MPCTVSVLLVDRACRCETPSCKAAGAHVVYVKKNDSSLDYMTCSGRCDWLAAAAFVGTRHAFFHSRCLLASSWSHGRSRRHRRRRPPRHSSRTRRLHAEPSWPNVRIGPGAAVAAGRRERGAAGDRLGWPLPPGALLQFCIIVCHLVASRPCAEQQGCQRVDRAHEWGLRWGLCPPTQRRNCQHVGLITATLHTTTPPSTMREAVSLHMGQSGIQTGNACWELCASRAG